MSLYELYLKDALGSVANAKAEDPYLTGARSVASWQMQPQTNAEAIWGPAVQGLLAGFLAGQGKKNVNETAFNKIASSNLIKALNPLGVGVSGPLTEAQSLAGGDIARQYGGAMPEGWTAESGISDLMLQLAQKEAQDTKDLARQKYLLENKLVEDPITKQIKADQDAIAATAQIVKSEEKAKAEGKHEGEIKKPIEIDATTARDITDKATLANRASAAAASIKDMNWLELRAAANIPYFDTDGKVAQLSDLADAALRDRSGATAPEGEKKDFRRILAGDWTLPPSRVAELLENFAERERQDAKSLLAGGSAQKDPTKLEKLLNPTAKDTAKTVDAPPTPPAGYELTGSRDANGNYGIRKIR